MWRNGNLELILLLAGAICTGSARADEITEFFDSLYGKEAARVSATPSKVDDVEFAKQLLEAAKGIEGQPKIVAMLCQKCYEFSSHSAAGYDTAIEAMHLLGERLPERKADCLDAIIQLQRGAYGRARGQAKQKAGESLLAYLLESAQFFGAAGQWGEAAGSYRQALPIATALRSAQRLEIQQLLKQAGSRQRAAMKISELQAKLKANPTDAASADQIVAIYIVDLDDPKRAADAAKAGSDTDAKKLAPLAAAEIETLSADDCLSLADWYRKLGDKAAPSSRLAMWNRAAIYYEKFLESNTEDGLAKFKATAGLKQVRAKFDALAAKGKPRFPANLKKGLVLHYDFQRPVDGAVKDMSGRGNHGKIVGASWVKHGRGTGNAVFELDGKDNLIAIPNSTLGQWNAFTYSIWVRAPRYEGSSWPAFIGSYVESPARNTTLGIWQSSGTFRMEIQTDQGNLAVQGVLKIPWDKWFHAALVYDGMSATEYLNGVPGKTFKVSGKLAPVSMLTVGRDHAMYDALRGAVDDPMIYGRALSAKEIRQLYKVQRGK